MSFISINKSDRNAFKKLGNRIGGLSDKLTKRMSTDVAKVSEKTSDRIKASLNKTSSGSRPVVRTNPRRIALSSPIGTSPNTDLGELEKSIKFNVSVSRGSRNIRAEVGTVGAFDNGKNYADYHEKNGRPFIEPEKKQFDSDIVKSANKIMKKISELK